MWRERAGCAMEMGARGSMGEGVQFMGERGIGEIVEFMGEEREAERKDSIHIH